MFYFVVKNEADFGGIGMNTPRRAVFQRYTAFSRETIRIEFERGWFRLYLRFAHH